jgi:hypothetical protein
MKAKALALENVVMAKICRHINERNRRRRENMKAYEMASMKRKRVGAKAEEEKSISSK